MILKNRFDDIKLKVATWLNDSLENSKKIGHVLELDKSPTPIRKGKIVKMTSPSEYDPDKPVTGGRVIHIMPKQLKKIKDAQEVVSNES